MYLFIDSADHENLTVALLLNENKIIQRQIKARYAQAEKLLPLVDSLLKKNRLPLKKIEAIAVVTGPGPFSAIRIGVATANALAFALAVPVIGITKDRVTVDKSLYGLIKSELRSNKTVMAVPAYGQEPNITKK